MFHVPLEHGTVRKHLDEGETMGTTDKIHDALTAADAPLFVWDARPLAGFIPAETRDEGWQGHSALSNLIIEATIARDRLAAELTQAGHVPLVSATPRTGPWFPTAEGDDARAIRGPA